MVLLGDQQFEKEVGEPLTCGSAEELFEALLNELEEAPEVSFLLPRIIFHLDWVGSTFADFEEWLGERADTVLRGKIMGRCAPREEYQLLFPVGGGRKFSGPHYVTAHNPPDLDTTVASFWGWVDAFAAEVTDGLHIWNFPGGRPIASIAHLFEQVVGEAIFSVAATHHRELPKVEGTVSLRDFCNREETRIPEEIKIISVVDHHRVKLETAGFATVTIADVQSCNTLMAEHAFVLNDQFPTHPQRARAEYLSYLYAILDDTDLLGRVTGRDVRVVAELLFRLKGEMVVDIKGLEPEEAARALLSSDDLYSLYRSFYERREKELETQIVQVLDRHLLGDTKVQKGGARVGQTKLFPRNFPSYLQQSKEIRSLWLERAKQVHEKYPELDLHIHMVTTIPGHEEVYSGETADYPHTDELWLWAPNTPPARKKLSDYLRTFCNQELTSLDHKLKVIGPQTAHLEAIYGPHFEDLEVEERPELVASMAILRLEAGQLTSRKSSITPHIPQTEA